MLNKRKTADGRQIILDLVVTLLTNSSVVDAFYDRCGARLANEARGGVS